MRVTTSKCVLLGANVDIVTIEHGDENDIGSINRSFAHFGRASSPYRDRVADRLTAVLLLSYS